MLPVFAQPCHAWRMKRVVIGPVAQWSELAAHNRLVGGSSPPGPTILILCSFDFNGLTSESTNLSLRFVSRCSRSALDELLHCFPCETFFVGGLCVALNLGKRRVPGNGGDLMRGAA
jgi:hypothetical protein